MRRFLLFLLFFLIYASGVHAGISIYEPKDKAITFDEIVMLRGLGKDLEILKVNERKIAFDRDGFFSCGLILKSGKNYVEVRALDKNGNHFVKKIRILKIKTFPDIETFYEEEKHWARNQIIYLATLGYIEGQPDDNYYPGYPVTRGELATWIARTKRLKIPALTEDVFFDVPKERWRAPYVKAVVDAGYMKPYDERSFGIDDPLSRRAVAEIAVVTEGYEVVEKIKPLFVDVPREEKGAFPIYIAKEKGLIIGVSEDIPIFEPDRALTRAEAAVLLSRFKSSISGIRDLFNFERGYSSANYCGVNVSPKIVAFSAEPEILRAEEKEVVRLRVEIADREGFFPISKVKADLSEIGGMPDVEMFDNGTHGDEIKDDLLYSLNVSLKPKESGKKILQVTVIDRLGWESEQETSLLVLE